MDSADPRFQCRWCCTAERMDKQVARVNTPPHVTHRTQTSQSARNRRPPPRCRCVAASLASPPSLAVAASSSPPPRGVRFHVAGAMAVQVERVACGACVGCSVCVCGCVAAGLRWKGKAKGADGRIFEAAQSRPDETNRTEHRGLRNQSRRARQTTKRACATDKSLTQHTCARWRKGHDHPSICLAIGEGLVAGARGWGWSGSRSGLSSNGGLLYGVKDETNERTARCEKEWSDARRGGPRGSRSAASVAPDQRGRRGEPGRASTTTAMKGKDAT